MFSLFHLHSWIIIPLKFFFRYNSTELPLQIHCVGYCFSLLDTIESTGALPPEVLFTEAVKILEEKCERVISELSWESGRHMRQRSKIAESAISVILQETSVRSNIFVVVVWLKKCELNWNYRCYGMASKHSSEMFDLNCVHWINWERTCGHELKWPFRLRQKVPVHHSMNRFSPNHRCFLLVGSLNQ